MEAYTMNGRKPTKEERKWMADICDLGCCVCRNERHGYTPCNVHHISGSKKPGAHLNTIPLCPVHHTLGGYGVAIHQGRVAWEKNFGTQNQLLKQVEELLK